MKRSGSDSEESPSGSAPKVAKSKDESEEKYTFFFGIESPFSQFHPANFTLDDMTYNCAEQYMMHQKAVVFKDAEMAKQILDTDNPKKMKSLGRKVANFDAAIWTSKCRDVVRKANIAKFSQNKTILAALLTTEGTVLVEAAPRDRLWGIGLGAKNPKAKKKINWRGRNWLGYTLTAVRDELSKKD